MGDNKFCTYCGSLNKNDAQYCVNCGKSFLQNNNVVQSNNDMEGNKLGIISLILYFGGPLILTTILGFLPTDVMDKFSSLGGLFPLAGIVTMIIGRVKYPSNKLLKIIMWIFIVLVILGILLLVLFLIWCHMACVSMDTSGCS